MVHLEKLGQIIFQINNYVKKATQNLINVKWIENFKHLPQPFITIILTRNFHSITTVNFLEITERFCKPDLMVYVVHKKFWS